MKYEVVELEEKRIEGLAVRTTNENNKAQADIALLWQRFFTEGVYESILNKANAKTIGLYTNYEGDYTKPYQFIVGVEVKEKTQQVLAIIPKGKYAKFVIKGDVQTAVCEAWNEIWNMNLNRTYQSDFEEYQERQEGEEQEIHIYIGIQ